MLKKLILIIILLNAFSGQELYAQPTNDAPLRLAVAGTTHGHVGWILGRKDKKDIQLVGIYEPNKELVQKQIKQYGIPAELFYDDLNKMLDNIKRRLLLLLALSSSIWP
jgi:hypothetical protein